MSVLGVALVVSGAAAAVWGVRATERRRPIDLAGALAAPAGILALIVGGVVLLVPGFLR